MTTKRNAPKPEADTPAATGGLKVGLPISFAEFAKEPVKGILFIALVAIGYLYVDGRIDKNNIIENQTQKIQILETKVDTLTQQLIKTNTLMSEATAELRALKTLGR